MHTFNNEYISKVHADLLDTSSAIKGLQDNITAMSASNTFDSEHYYQLFELVVAKLDHTIAKLEIH